MNMTLRLARLLEGSDKSLLTELDSRTVEKLFEHSVKNRMRTSLLERLADVGKIGVFGKLWEKEQADYSKMLNAVSRTSSCLEEARIEHAVFKTIRPYKSTTVDIDTMVFGKNYRRAVDAMKKAGYPMLAEGPMSATFVDPEAKLGIDIYAEIAVSAICYIDKERFAKYARSIGLPNGGNATVLAPEADLLAIIAHSVIKEQMYTLSEYYSFIHYLGRMRTKEFLQLAKQSNLTSAVRTHASITALLQKTTHGKIPEGLHQILEGVGREDFETTRLVRKDFETPHKYHPITVARSLIEIGKGKKARDSMAMQIYLMLNPNFSRKFLKAFVEHVIRETY